MYRQIETTDIESFKKTYQNSPEEEEDLLEFFTTAEGDMSALLESIPLSEESDIPRFLSFFDSQIASNDSKNSNNLVPFQKTYLETKDKIRRVAVELSKGEAEERMEALAESIRGNMEKRREGGVLADIMAKYGGGMKAIEGGKKKGAKGGKGKKGKKV